MKLHEHRDQLQQTLIRTHHDLHELVNYLRMKIGRTYPDGTRDNLVNAETDVLPALHELIRALDDHIPYTGIRRTADGLYDLYADGALLRGGFATRADAQRYFDYLDRYDE